MTEYYYVNPNKQWNGDNEVHKSGCSYMPSNPVSLGQHYGCNSAVSEARSKGYNANGCYYCCYSCHTS